MEEQVLEERESRENAPALTQAIDNVNRIVRALYIYKKEGSYKDLAGPTGLYPAIASQALSSSRDLGLTKSAGKKGWYLLSPHGVEYARYLTENRTEECQSLLKRIILGNPLWTDVVSYLRTSEGVARNPTDLIMSTVETKLGKQWSPGMRRQVSESIVSVLEYAGIVKRDSGKIISLIGLTDAVPRDRTTAPARPELASTIFPSFRAPTQAEPGFYEIMGDGFYMKIQKSPSVIAEAYDHLNLIMKRNSQQPTPTQTESPLEMQDSSH